MDVAPVVVPVRYACRGGSHAALWTGSGSTGTDAWPARIVSILSSTCPKPERVRRSVLRGGRSGASWTVAELVSATVHGRERATTIEFAKDALYGLRVDSRTSLVVLRVDSRTSLVVVEGFPTRNLGRDKLCRYRGFLHSPTEVRISPHGEHEPTFARERHAKSRGTPGTRADGCSPVRNEVG